MNINYYYCVIVVFMSSIICITTFLIMYEIFDAIKLEIRKKKNIIRSALNDFKLVGKFLVCDIIECDRVTFVCVLLCF